MKKRLRMDSKLRGVKGQWWENIGCIITKRALFETVNAVKSLKSFLTSFLRCQKDIANLPDYFGHAKPNP